MTIDSNCNAQPETPADESVLYAVLCHTGHHSSTYCKSYSAINTLSFDELRQ